MQRILYTSYWNLVCDIFPIFTLTLVFEENIQELTPWNKNAYPVGCVPPAATAVWDGLYPSISMRHYPPGCGPKNSKIVKPGDHYWVWAFGDPPGQTPKQQNWLWSWRFPCQTPQLLPWVCALKVVTTSPLNLPTRSSSLETKSPVNSFWDPSRNIILPQLRWVR